MLFLRFLIFVLLLWIITKLLGSLFRKPPAESGREFEQDENGAAGSTVRDPVCGMYMDPRLALREGNNYYCSEECRSRHSEQPRER